MAVTHRNAAAFVDAEARLFLQGDPLDRVIGCWPGCRWRSTPRAREMWLAWRNGACLVPARGRWYAAAWTWVRGWCSGRSTSSTVPTLASLWPPEALEAVRLLIFGGEARPPELGERLAVDGARCEHLRSHRGDGRRVRALLDGKGPVRIGLPLQGWDLAVVDADGNPSPRARPVSWSSAVSVWRYLDPAKDAEKYAPMPSLGWERAYRSGDLVKLESEGLLFQGRADDQVKVGGRRIELGEIDNALQQLPGVGGAVAVRKSAAGNSLLVGYLVSTDPDFDVAQAHRLLTERLPAAMVPRLALVDELPTRTSGKVDRAALPWPLPGVAADTTGLSETEQWLAGLWTDVPGCPSPMPTPTSSPRAADRCRRRNW